MEEVYLYVAILFLLELYESSWQRGDTFKDIVSNIYKRYKRGIFYFLLSHPSFYFLLFVGLKYNLANFWFLSIIFLKFLDISYKLTLVKKIEENSLGEVLPVPLDIKVEKWMSYINALLYPFLLYMAFSNLT